MALTADQLAAAKARIGGAESGGNPNAKNALSSASGTYQFIDSTWVSTVKQNPSVFGDLSGKSNAEILAVKNDPGLQSAAMDISLNNYSKTLTNAGIEVTPGSLYSSHFLGPQGAVNLYKQDDNTPVNQFLSPDVMKVNPNLYNNGQPITAGQLKQQMESKAGGAAGANPPGGGLPGAAGAGGGAGCAAGALMGVAGIAAGGLLGGLGAGISGALSNVTGALGLSSITGAMSGVMGSISGALSSVTGALSGALGGLTGSLGGILNNTLQGAISGGVRGLLSGQGLNGFMNGAIGGFSSGVGGALSGALSTMTGGISGQVMGTLSGLGGNILPSLTGVLPGNISNMLGGALQGAIGGVLAPLNNVLRNPMNLPNAVQQFAAGGGLTGVVNTVAANMVGKNMPGGVNNFISNINMASAISGQANAVVGGVIEGLGQRYGNGPGGLGANYRNANDMISYGATSISRNLPVTAANMVETGKFDTKNLLRLQAPGSVAAQIINKGLGQSTGLIPKLIAAGIPVLDIDNPNYDTRIQQILTSINNPDAINAVKTAFNSYRSLDNLGQLTDLNHMMPDVVKNGGYKTFDDLGKHLISIGITQAEDFQQIGNTLGQVNAGLDLNHYSQLNTPYHKPTADLLLSMFGYGGGTLGEITMVDFLGTPAGYVHTDSLQHVLNANDYLNTLPEGKELQRRIGILRDLINGKFTIPGAPINQAEGGGGSGGN